MPCVSFWQLFLTVTPYPPRQRDPVSGPHNISTGSECQGLGCSFRPPLNELVSFVPTNMLIDIESLNMNVTVSLSLCVQLYIASPLLVLRVLLIHHY